MQDQNQTTSTITANPPLMSDDAVIQPGVPDSPDVSTEPITPGEPQDSSPVAIMKDVSEKIKSVHNILIALSSDPSVDEIATAIALSLCLDRAGKRATAIYSGTTPNALQFLNPERTFETNANVLKDFVIALNKEKADHLRYTLDGDYVKIFITPYKNSISEADLEFSLGDFNIELVLALNIPSGIDLDDALREHGRVMHDATVINITNGNPGKFGDIEWSDKSKSSIAEMVADLLYSAGGDKAIEPEEATAFLTGIVAATDHFTNNMTTANALQIASNLIRSGADRKLITENIGLDSENMFFLSTPQERSGNDGSLKIEHETDEPLMADAPAEDSSAKPSEDREKPTEPEEAGLLADLQAVADSLKDATEIVQPTVAEQPAVIERPTVTEQPTTTEQPTVVEPSAVVEQPISTEQLTAPLSTEAKPELTLTPSENFMAETPDNHDYGQMLEETLADSYVVPGSNPAMSAAPVAPSAPEVNNVPEINYTPVPNNEDILPPPPAPPVDPSVVMPNAMPPMSSDNVAPSPATPTLNS